MAGTVIRIASTVNGVVGMENDVVGTVNDATGVVNDVAGMMKAVSCSSVRRRTAQGGAIRHLQVQCVLLHIGSHRSCVPCRVMSCHLPQVSTTSHGCT